MLGERGSAVTDGEFFISYRRADSRGDTGRLYDRLAAEFGPAAVFRDVDAIAPGEPFARVLQDSLGRCDALLAVIGPDWLNAQAGGRRRLDDPGDPVRVEIETAIERGIPAIPVLVGSAAVPGEHELPEPLRPLVATQAAALHELNFHDDVDLLVDRLRQIARARGRRAPVRPRRVSGDEPWLCRDPDWFAAEPEPVWPVLAIDWPPEAVHAVRAGDRGVSDEVEARVAPMLERLWRRFGVIVPGVCMREQAAGGYAVRVAGVPVRSGEDGGLDAPIAALEAAIAADPKAVVGHQEVAGLLTTQGDEVLDAVLAEPGALTDLVLACRALLAERVPVTPFGPIVTAFRRIRPTGASPAELVEELRSVPEVRARLPANDGRHGLLLLSRDAERAFARSLDHSGGQTVLAMAPETMQAVLGGIHEAVAEAPDDVVIVVEHPAIRPFVRRLVELAYPYLLVLSRRELQHPLEPAVVGEIELG